MALIPAPKNLIVVKGATFIYVLRRVLNQQTVVLTGSGTGFTMTAYRTTTAQIPLGSAASVVQNALQGLPQIGAGGVTVSGAGTSGSPYLLSWSGALQYVEVPLVEVHPTAGITEVVDYVPVDWTGWTASMKIEQHLADGKLFDTTTPILVLTESTTVTTVGKIIFGYIPPPTPGASEPSPVLTNGQLAIKIPAVKTLTLDPPGPYGAGYSLNVIGPGTGGNILIQTLIAGTYTLQQEPT